VNFQLRLLFMSFLLVPTPKVIGFN